MLQTNTYIFILWYDGHFWFNTLSEGMNPLIPPPNYG